MTGDIKPEDAAEILRIATRIYQDAGTREITLGGAGITVEIHNNKDSHLQTLNRLRVDVINEMREEFGFKALKVNRKCQ